MASQGSTHLELRCTLFSAIVIGMKDKNQRAMPFHTGRFVASVVFMRLSIKRWRVCKVWVRGVDMSWVHGKVWLLSSWAQFWSREFCETLLMAGLVAYTI